MTTSTTPYVELNADSITEAVRPVRVSTPAGELLDPSTGLPARTVDILPPGWTAVEARTDHLVDARPAPLRAKGTVSVDSGDDLVVAVGQRTADGARVAVYGDPRDLTITAVLNDDHGNDPGWGDYRVQAQLQRTPEWSAWLNGQGLQSQGEFAEFIEDHLEDIVEPEPLEMLELAQTFHAHTTARFSVSARLQSGAVALNYVEDQDVSSGDGNVEVPGTFAIAVRPFYGADRIRVVARFRYRVGRGDLQLGWKLNRPEDIESTVFDEQLAAVGAALDVTPIHGRR